MKITEKQLQEFANKRMAEAFQTPAVFRERMMEVLDFAIENEMDEGASAYYDKLVDGIGSFFEQELAKVPDSPHKRKMLRLIALTKRKHQRAENLLLGLTKPLAHPFPVAQAGKPIFFASIQAILDLLFDATREDQHGAAQFTSLSLLYWTVDELNVAFHLAERKYTTQAFSHLRTIHDLVDKAELFFERPELVELWGGADSKRIIKELSPSAVRAKLGKTKFDPVYDFLTERGMHGTFSAVRQRAIQRGREHGRRRVSIWVGGAAWIEEVEIAVSSCILAALLVLSTVVKIYESRLHKTEIVSILNDTSQSAREFLETHLLKPLKHSGADASALSELVNRLTKTQSERAANGA